MSHMGLVYRNVLGQADGAMTSQKAPDATLDVNVSNSHSWWRDESSNGAIVFTPGRFLTPEQAEAEAKASRSTILRIQGTKVSFGKQTDLNLQDPETCVKFLANMFGFLGVGISRLSVTGGTVQQVLSFIYALQIPAGVTWVQLSTCGCNMGHCSAVTGIDVQDPPPRTFEDMFKLWSGAGNELEPGLIEYEYPDSVFLYVESVRSLPVRNVCTGEALTQPAPNLLAPGQKLFSWYYSR